MTTRPLASMSTAATEPATLPAPAAAPSRGARLVPAGLLLLFAFLLASVPAYASAVWRHLATGRALVDGSYVFGTDPFAYTTNGARWVNHAWLYDLALYGLYQFAGPYLVVFSAALAIVLAALMLAAARPRSHPWTATFAIALALVALGPYLVLSPAIIGYVLFAFILWWLDRIAAGTLVDRPVEMAAPLLLAVLLWANCDEWFLLGPITISLFALCTANVLSSTRQLLLAAGVAAAAICLLNPHHVHLFALPSALQDAAVTGEAALSPLRELSRYTAATLPIPLAAYFVLGVLCLFALLAAAAARRSWAHVAVLLLLLALSLYRTSAIPLFAIAAGPFLGRGWQGAAVRPVSRRLRVMGAVVGTLALAGLMAIAAPGWLQSTNQPRGWFVHTDASLRQLAQTALAWREAGQLPAEARGFNTSVDAAHYLEWFCPGAKVFIDSRPNLYPPDVITDFQEIRRTLAAGALAPEQQGFAVNRALLERWRVTHLLVSDPAERPLVAMLGHLWQAPAEWSLAAIAGRATVFTWRTPPAGTPPLALPPLDLAQRAFDPATTSSAPRHPSDTAPAPPPWWHCWVWSDSAAALDRDEALVYLAHFEALQPTYRARNLRLWQAKLAVAALAPAGPVQTFGMPALTAALPMSLLAASEGMLPADGRALVQAVQIAMTVAQPHVDDGPLGSLLLAIRAARRAIAADPNDAVAHLRLGHAYERMLTRTVERSAADEFPLLTEMRRVQAIAALTTALELRPDLLPAHQLLVGLYQRANGLDLALAHLRQQLRLTRAAGPRPDETPLDFAARIDLLSAHEQALAREVRDRLDLVTTKSFDLPAYAKARLADNYGLPGHALDLLQRSNYGDFGIEGAIIEMHLLLHAGHAREARSWLQPEQEAKMGPFNYQWLQILCAAADGDYTTAASGLQDLHSDTVDVPALQLHQAPPRTALAFVLGEQVLAGASLAPFARHEDLKAVLDNATQLALLPRRQAEDRVLRGVLALETGAIESAASALRVSLAKWDGADGPARIAHHDLGLIGQR